MGNMIDGSCLAEDGRNNCLCTGKEPGHCCYCCLGEEHRVARVFDHFVPLKLADATQKPNELNMYVGRVVLPDDPSMLGLKQCCYTPGSCVPCVYWRVTVEEEWVTWIRRERHEGEGEQRRVVDVHYEPSLRWRTIVDHENSTDFYLQDGEHKIFVNGSKRDDIRVQSDWDAGGKSGSWKSFTHEDLPVGIKWLCMEHSSQFGGWQRTWHTGGMGHRKQAPPEMPTGNFKWKECKFEVNEKLACLGKASPAFQDPFTGNVTMALMPVMIDSITKESMENAEPKWSTWDRWSWIDMQKNDPDGTVLLTDNAKYVQSIEVEPAANIPTWQAQVVPEYAPWGAGMPQQVAPMAVQQHPAQVMAPMGVQQQHPAQVMAPMGVQQQHPAQVMAPMGVQQQHPAQMMAPMGVQQQHPAQMMGAVPAQQAPPVQNMVSYPSNAVVPVNAVQTVPPTY